MQFDQVAQLTSKTMTGPLCAAWGTTAADVVDCTYGRRPMTLREAGALAELHGMKLEDILPV